jgi:hypothetical protein
MSTFNYAMGKNMVKLTLITIASLSSTLGLRTELAIILGDIFWATWFSIVWVGIIIAVLSYYKAKQDINLIELRDFKEHRRMLGVLNPQPEKTNKTSTAVLLNETKGE